MTAPAELLPCVVKGCAWRGTDPNACPLHSDDAWDRQWELVPEFYANRGRTRHRR